RPFGAASIVDAGFFLAGLFLAGPLCLRAFKVKLEPRGTEDGLLINTTRGDAQ
ncbi:MAG: hypothetical protein Q9180_001832, partial [Flavoplaca navasiana]